VRLRENTYRAYTKERDGSIQVFSSANGLDWEWVGEAFRDERYRHATDSDVFQTPDGWVMLISLGPTLLRCTSRDGLKFTTDGTILELGGSVSDTVPVPGGWRTFFHVNADPRTGGKMVIRSAFTADGRSWRVEEGDRLRAPDDGPARLGVADPSPLQLPDGTWLMAVKSFIEPSRPGTASALQPRARPDGPPDNRLVPGGAPRFPNNEPERRERTDIRSPEGGAPGFRDAGTAARDSQRGEPLRARGQIRVEKIDSKYKVASGAKPGVFATGQDADLMLGGFGFNNTGGALRFNHPTGLASDGKMLLMTDRWNNRVLVWKSAPAKNTPPDLVLGQPDFAQNNPGKGKHHMNWPGNVAITPDGQKIAVTDTNNDRILIWNSFPTTSGTPADLVLDLAELSGGVPAPGVARPPNDGERRSPPRREPGGFPRPEPEFPAPPGRRAGPEAGDPNATPRPRFGGGMQFGWPWGVWTDGKKLAVVATHGSAVLTWNAFPARDNQPPDLVLRPSDAGTPRNVTSDGNWFAVSDHNNRPANRPATMVWRTFPTSGTQEPDFKWGEWMKGTFTPDRQLVLAGMAAIWIWSQTPSSDTSRPHVELRPAGYRNGDGPDAVVANGRFYVCNYNGNNLLVWNSLPTQDNQPPDFSLGSDTPEQDVWAENFFIQNPVVATDGQSLFISSDFDRKLFVWRQLPDESGARPDLVFHLPEAPWDNALHGQTLALAGKSTVVIWRKLPLSGEQPDLVLSGSIGSIRLGELTGVALDDRYFYLSDRQSDSIYVWEGIPAHDQEPKCTLPMRSPGHLNSDGTYLAAAPFEGQAILLWRVNELGSGAQATSVGGLGRFNLPGQALVAKGHLFVADRGFNRVHVWHRLEDALAGKAADALLGAENDQDRDPEIGRSKLFSPGSLAFGRGYLWVGEFKFSTRILRFSPEP
jgi:DNA-binding beta-propeller fold protein YncE